MVNPKWNYLEFGVAIALEVALDPRIGHENPLGTSMNILEILVHIFFLEKSIAHAEILWIFGVK